MDRKIVSLYEHFKNTPKKLKIVCDWDEVIQACEPWAYFNANIPKEIREQDKLKAFSQYFQAFWENENSPIEYSNFGSHTKQCLAIPYLGFSEKQIQIKNSPNFYQEAPFLTIAEDLLKLIKEDKVENLIFLSAYDKRKFPEGDERKFKIFAETFEKLILEKSLDGVGLKLIPFENETQGQNKADWIKESAADFDIVIDDNPLICKEVIRKQEFCSCVAKQIAPLISRPLIPICPHRRMKVIAPHYPAVKHDKRVLLVKNEVSGLKKEDFIKKVWK